MQEPSEDIERRKPVWEVLSDLFLDTEIDDMWLRYIARKLAGSGYADDELEGILYREVFPVCSPNLKHPAGVWTGFDLTWLQEQILSNVTQSQNKLSDSITDHWMIESDWRKIKELLPEARLQARTMMNLSVFPLSISPDLKFIAPNVVVGCLTANVHNSQHDASLWQEIDTVAAKFRGSAMDEARKLPPLKALRDAYRALGNDPTRYRGSNEALVRRISQGKALYHVNTVVDINNLMSLETLHSAGTFDLDHVQPPIIFRVGQPGEVYSGIGRGEIKIEGLPVFVDQLGPFGSTTSDSERTMVRLETTRIMMVIISFLGIKGMAEILARAAGLLEKYAAATEIETWIVT